MALEQEIKLLFKSKQDDSSKITLCYYYPY